MKGIPDNSIDGIVTDPPYGLEFMGKDWDKGVPGVHFWIEMLRVLKPGGYLLAFGGTRTYHRMAVAIEDAGFEIRDMIEWVYGSGFPKSLSVGKAVDKLQGNGREVIGEGVSGKPETHTSSLNMSQVKNNTFGGKFDITKGTSDFEGWGTALKPAHEPICMARKPLSEKTVAKNVLKWGTGGINIDGSRVEGEPTPINKLENWSGFGQEKRPNYVQEINNMGRFPANLIHDNSEEVRECFPETGKSTGGRIGNKGSALNMMGQDYEAGDPGYGDSGNASRFFKSIIYQAKASKSERGTGNNHPTVKPVALMKYLIEMITFEKGIVLDPFMGSGTTGLATINTNRRFIGIDISEEYCQIARQRTGYEQSISLPVDDEDEWETF
jgi:site-specific DNA-methyltransferase (adenine-specific)